MEKLNAEEEFVVAVTRMNRKEKKTEWRRKWECGRWSVVVQWRSSKSFWGRFGGGWQWELGFQAARGTIIFNLLIFSITVNRKSKAAMRKAARIAAGGASDG